MARGPKRRLRFEEFGRNRRGVVAVEFALIAPIVLVMAAGIVNFGELTNYRMDLDRAIRAATNVAVISPPMNGNYGHITDAFNYAAPTAASRDLLVTSSCECAGGAVIGCSSGCADGSERQVLVNIAVTDVFDFMIPLPVFGSSMSVVANLTVRVS